MRDSMVKKSKTFDPLAPFADARCYKDFLGAFKAFQFKLYGKLRFKIVSKSKYEFDLNAGEIHYTEQDFKGLSVLVDKLNKRWGTKITYCLFPSKKHPKNILINVRSPKAPTTLKA